MNRLSFFIASLLFLIPLYSKGQQLESFSREAPQSGLNKEIRLKTNVLPWAIAVPNLGAELIIGERWSVALDVLYCPWKISDKYSIKTAGILPEGRWWLRSNRKGSFFNVHINLGWYNVRANNSRYQDTSRPLLGAGIGYGYRFVLKNKWGLEFEVGAGVMNTKYHTYYNIPNGALKDTRVSTYWGIDRLAIAFTYDLCDL